MDEKPSNGPCHTDAKCGMLEPDCQESEKVK